MAELTITEALAEIKTLSKRIAKKREGINPYLARQDRVKDPLERDGGSEDFIKREFQAIGDMEERIVSLRAAIARANATTELSVNGSTRTIANWLTWRREVAPARQAYLFQLRTVISSTREQETRKGNAFVQASAVAQVGEINPNDVIVNVSEAEIAQEVDKMVETMGTLDGLLSLKNATTTIEVG